MKIILTKDCKDGKANTIIEVASGYGTNFLVKKGFGVPYNEKNYAQLQKTLNDLVANEHETRTNALREKEKIEELVLKYQLTANIDGNHNLNVYGSVSTKDVDKSLKELGFKLPKHSLQKIHLVSEGNRDVEVNLYKDIIAKLRIEIKINVKK
ncbi:50S ribosomal protein L9 [Mycoplasmopsis felis]|uniref:50S ribosomal protein L9 n=1 Tax=Mycoplasmopsis felis TaxID=33923 RepID=UPI0021B00504|nr:50S ribosomal protein L9 [Mycoplasmopsis felis]MCU9933887.1 50S ribosomal protein L9 [Mycoplasmopsis felis]UWV80111.1 50S ribosomal protein L9 [Mycoplasmopsis felis]